MKTRCCWCNSGFVKIGDHYWCETPACRQRQADHALVFQNVHAKTNEPFYVPLPRQVAFDSSLTPMLLGGGAAGASKSHQARFGLYRRAFHIPGFEALILRKTWSELEKHHLRLMEREAHRLKARGLPVEFSKTDREFRIKHGNEISVIEGGHMENPDDVEKYLSRERDAIVCDEGSTFEPQPLLELSTRARSTKPLVAAFARRMRKLPDHAKVPRGGAVFWVLSNPGGPAASMLRDFFIDHAPDFDDYPQLAGTDSAGKPLYDPGEWGYIPGNLEDNPYLPDSYERDLAVLPPWRYQQLRYNNWDVLQGLFFVEFDARIHVKTYGRLGSDVTWFRSMDYGYMDPNVTLWWAGLPDGRWHVAAEQKRQHCNIPQLAKDIRIQTVNLGIERVRYTVADKYSMGGRTSDDDKAETRGDTLRKCGISTITVSQDREQGWTRIRELLSVRSDGLPWLTIDPSCRYLIRALSAAVSDKNNPEDIAQFKDDHPLDALRLGAMSLPATAAFRRPPLPRNAVGRLLEETRSAAIDVSGKWR